MPGAIQSRQGLPLLALVAPEGDFDVRIASVGADAGLGNSHFEQPGIVQLETDDLGQFLPDRHRYPLRPALVHLSGLRPPGPRLLRKAIRRSYLSARRPTAPLLHPPPTAAPFRRNHGWAKP